MTIVKVFKIDSKVIKYLKMGGMTAKNVKNQIFLQRFKVLNMQFQCEWQIRVRQKWRHRVYFSNLFWRRVFCSIVAKNRALKKQISPNKMPLKASNIFTHWSCLLMKISRDEIDVMLKFYLQIANPWFERCWSATRANASPCRWSRSTTGCRPSCRSLRRRPCRWRPSSPRSSVTFRRFRTTGNKIWNRKN